MTDTIKGLNCKVEVALTFDSPISPTAVTKAYPPVATLNAHGITDGEVGYWLATAGMVQMHKQAFMADNVTANTWEMPGLDSTDYDTFAAGPTVVMAATWATVAEAAAYGIGGGAQSELNDTRLMDVKARAESGLLAAQTITVDVRNAKVSSAAMAFIERQAMRSLAVLVKISQAGTVVRVGYGVPSLPGENVGSGELANGQFAIVCPGFAVKPNV